MPSFPATLHASQGPVQETPQQTPSVQYPEAHSAARLHASPAPRAKTHAPALQNFPSLQSASRAHGEAQAPAPLQVKAPHSLPGSVPGASAVQPPSSPGTLQAWQVPVQAALQHTPSTQKPEAQSAPAAQERPLPFGPLQLPASQVLAFLHSPLSRHAASQLPSPLQKLPPHSLPVSVPADAAVQRPTLPGTSHASQGPVHEASQHTPSVQWPEPHSAAEVQAVPPAVFATQLPKWHR